MTILDRYVIARVAPLLAIGFLIECGLLVTENPDAATTAAALVFGVSLAMFYTDLVRSGEYHGMVGGGISPRRIVAPVIVLLVLLQALVVAFCYRFEHGDARSAYIGYTLAALQPVLVGSAALPLCVRSTVREPWSHVLLLLLGYVACVFLARLASHGAGIGSGLFWIYIIPPLAIADILLFRTLEHPAREA